MHQSQYLKKAMRFMPMAEPAQLRYARAFRAVHLFALVVCLFSVILPHVCRTTQNTLLFREEAVAQGAPHLGVKAGDSPLVNGAYPMIMDFGNGA